MKKKISSELNKLIPGGCHTYSKADNQFSDNAPQAILRGEGCYIIGVDNVRYLDCGMGLTSVSIGHSDRYVNSRVKKEIEKWYKF